MILSPQELLKRHGIDYVATKSGKYTTGCPSCGSGYLNVTVQRDQVVWYCHQCDIGGGEQFDQQQKTANDAGLGPIRQIYDYTDESGKLLFQVLRFEPPGQPKQFRQRTGPDQVKWSIKGVRIVPYRLPELLADLAADHVVFIVEGERDVNSLRALGVPATCNPMGAKKWWPEFNQIFRDADVMLVPDNDQPGRDHAQLVASNLQGSAKRIRLLDLAKFDPNFEVSQDISDWLQNHSVDLLWQIVGDLPDYKAPGSNGNAGPEQPAAAAAGQPVILSKAQFLEGFVPPDYLIEGMLQRRFIYALTGQTGHAKTAVALLLARLVSCADKNTTLARHRVEKGRVVYFVGENPDDVRMRIIGANALRDDQPEKDDIWFIPGVFNIAGMMHVLGENFRSQGEVSLIIIDTSAAYFLGNEELSNTQMGNYARMLRTLTTLPGGPCVLVLCHPIKHVTEPDQLLPRGGGAYLAEMDGNLTLWRKTDDLVELNYNKMRGPGFQPIAFRLDTIRTLKLVDNKGRRLPTVQAVAIDDVEEDQRADKAENDEDKVLVAMLSNPVNSLAGWAKHLNWVADTGEPYKMRVQRIVERLAKQHPILTKKVRGNRWTLTEEGKTVARKASLRFRDEDADKSQETMF
jgi:hypothetical protein